MKKVLLFLLVAFSSISLYSQSTKDLDAKNGFDQFKLGDDSFSRWKDVLEKIDVNTPDFDSYIYLGDPLKVFGFKSQITSLAFQNDRLVDISITFFEKGKGQKFMRDYQKKFQTIKNNFRSLYGDPQSFEMPGDSVTIGSKTRFRWEGKKTLLHLSRVYSSEGDGFFAIIVNIINRHWYEQ